MSWPAHRIRTLTLLAAVVLAGCARFPAGAPVIDAVPAPGQPPGIEAPADTVVVIYNHGSRQEFHADPCYPGNTTSRWGTPQIVLDLSQQRIMGKSIRVYTLCTALKRGEFRHTVRKGEPKVVKRAREIQHQVNQFAALGVPRRQIFLAGHSAGGWASLLTLTNRFTSANAAIVFAPAFAGYRKSRSEGWQWLHDRQCDALKRAGRIDALVFAFAKDPFNSIEDLRFLERIPGVVFVPLSTQRLEELQCDPAPAHRTAFAPCFARSQLARIKAFIAARLHSTRSPWGEAMSDRQ